MIIRPGALGDTLMLLPAIAELRTSAEIALVARSPGLHFFKVYVSSCTDYEGPGWHQLFLNTPDDVHALPIPKVDRLVAFLSDPHGTIDKNLRTYLTATSVHVFPAFPPKRAKIHVALYLAQCLKKAGLAVDPYKSLEEACTRPLLDIDVPSKEEPKRVIFHPGSGGHKKNYPPDFWLEMMIRLGGLGKFSDEKEKFTLLLGPAEEQIYPFFKKNALIGGAEIVFSPEWDRLRSLLRQATLYIGHDSGITHLAAMLGTRAIAFFKNTSIDQWRPLGPSVRVIENERASSGLVEKVFRTARELMGNSYESY